MNLSTELPARSIEVFREAIRKHFDFLKRTDSLVDLHSRGLPLPNRQGLLVPVCELHADDEPLIQMLARWRDENSFAFPTQFTVTDEGTRRWLRERLLDVADRLLLLVLDRHGHPVGHVGVASCDNDRGDVEVDNVVRGVQQRQPGLMTHAVQTLIGWLDEQFLPQSISLRVLDDNAHAVAFYRRLGFVEHAQIPLMRVARRDVVSLEEMPDRAGQTPDCNFLVMRYQPKRASCGSAPILTAGPSTSPREWSYVLDAARYGWNQQWDKYLSRFEEQFAERCNVRFAMATSSCTGAMHLALLALGIGPEDEVIVPDLTWVATASAVCYVGAVPVFADVDPVTLCMDPDSFEQQITAKTKAVIPVHLYGHPARMDRILAIAGEHNLRVVEDAAPSIGAEFLGRPAGSFGDFGCFSFQGAKLLVTGEGGMLLTDDEQSYQRAGTIGDHGRVPGSFWINELGRKYKMSNLQAAFGWGQLQRVDELVEAKRRVFSWYQEGLQSAPHLTLLREGPGARSAYWMTNILVQESAPLSRDGLREELRRRNVDTRPVFPAISQYPFWPRRQSPQPVARRIGEQGINLPSGVCLKRDEVDYICRTIRSLMRGRVSNRSGHGHVVAGS